MVGRGNNTNFSVNYKLWQYTSLSPFFGSARSKLFYVIYKIYIIIILQNISSLIFINFKVFIVIDPKKHIFLV